MNIVITGVDHGLGLAFLEKNLKEGHHVIGGYYLPLNDGLETLLEQYPENLLLAHVDIGNTESVKAFGQAVVNYMPSVDILINNGGVLGSTEGTMEKGIDYEDIINTFNINALGALRVTQALYKNILTSDKKTVVNICSEAGSIGANTRDGWFGYTMSKAALNMAGSVMHQNLKREGGQVIQIHPGYLRSYMHGHYNDEGHLETDEAAAMIMAVVEEQMGKKVTDQPAYLDYKGDPLVW